MDFFDVRCYFILRVQDMKKNGEGGIRTRGELSPTQHFQCCTFGRSVTSPNVTKGYHLRQLASIRLHARTRPECRVLRQAPQVQGIQRCLFGPHAVAPGPVVLRSAPSRGLRRYRATRGVCLFSGDSWSPFRIAGIISKAATQVIHQTHTTPRNVLTWRQSETDIVVVHYRSRCGI